MTRTLLPTICILAAASTAHADTWTPTVELVPADVATVRVLEPDGYRFTIDGRSDTAPAVFTVANRDQYVVVEATAPDGATWKQKIEVRSYNQTVLRLRHERPAPAAEPKQPSAPAATYVGVLFNTTHLCRKTTERVSVRFDIVSGNQVLTSNALEPRSRADVSVPAGEYTVRKYVARNKEWEFAGSQTLSVSKDGWVHGARCSS